jgi:hypothetical protein
MRPLLLIGGLVLLLAGLAPAGADPDRSGPDPADRQTSGSRREELALDQSLTASQRAYARKHDCLAYRDFSPAQQRLLRAIAADRCRRFPGRYPESVLQGKGIRVKSSLRPAGPQATVFGPGGAVGADGTFIPSQLGEGFWIELPRTVPAGKQTHDLVAVLDGF